jgi:hypothetical protein
MAQCHHAANRPEVRQLAMMIRKRCEACSTMGEHSESRVPCLGHKKAATGRQNGREGHRYDVTQVAASRVCSGFPGVLPITLHPHMVILVVTELKGLSSTTTESRDHMYIRTVQVKYLSCCRGHAANVNQKPLVSASPWAPVCVDASRLWLSPPHHVSMTRAMRS